MKPVIICVDDESLILDSLKMLLKEHFGEGYSIETAENGNDALELIEELISDGAKIPVLISDYIMPEKKGDELLIIAHSKIPDTFKILLTGQADLQGVENAVNKASLYRFLSKPWVTENFIQTIEEALKSFEQITQEKNHNIELEESEKKYKSPIESSSDIIFSLDKETRITAINQAVKSILNYEPEILLDKNFSTLVYKSDSINEKILKENLLELISSKGVISFNCNLVNADGDPKEMLIKFKYAADQEKFSIFGTASSVEEDLLLQFCETETQVYKIEKSITQIDIVCKRISDAIIKYSNPDDVLAIKLCLIEFLISMSSREQKLTIEYSLNPDKVEIWIAKRANNFTQNEQISSRNGDNQSYPPEKELEIVKKYFDICEFDKKDNSIFLAKHFVSSVER